MTVLTRTVAGETEHDIGGTTVKQKLATGAVTHTHRAPRFAFPESAFGRLPRGHER